jgi:predicted nucleic acid-binding protein
MKAVYADTSALLKLYWREVDSAEAIAVLTGYEVPWVYSLLHEVELPNAVYLKRFRGECTAEQESEVLASMRRDLQTGRLRRSSSDPEAIFARAADLASKYSARLGTRSLDLLHVAAALECGSTDFVSYDARQRKVAAGEGLRVMPRALKRKV